MNIYSITTPRVVQIFSLLLSVSAVVFFVNFSLNTSADQFKSDFEQQLFFEITKGDTFLLSRKLAAMAKNPHIACIQATKAGSTFFEEQLGACKASYFRAVRKVENNNQQIEIVFSYAMQRDLAVGLSWFLALQALLASGLIFFERVEQQRKAQVHMQIASIARQVAHDVQSPLAVLKLSSLNGRSTNTDSAISRLQRLVDDLLEKKPPFEPATLGTILRSLKKEKVAEWQDHLLIDLVFEGGTETLLLPGDASRWRRIFSNLLNNSAESCVERPVRVQIICRTDGDEIHIALADDGQGMTQEVLASLGSTEFKSSKIFGFGLGVASSRGWLRRYRASLDYESTPGVGTVATLRVPLRQQVFHIEDDVDLAKLWSFSTQKINVDLVHYGSWADFWDNRSAVQSGATLFVDIEFKGEKLDFERVERQLKRLPETDIYLSTGSDSKQFTHLSWVDGIIGKEPPWLCDRQASNQKS